MWAPLSESVKGCGGDKTVFPAIYLCRFPFPFCFISFRPLFTQLAGLALEMRFGHAPFAGPYTDPLGPSF